MAALFLMIFNVREDRQAGVSSQKIAQQLREIIPDDNSSKDSEGGVIQTKFNWDTLPSYIQNPEMAMPVAQVDGHDYIGLLEIPDIGITLPVMSEWNYPSLRIAPCRYTGTIYMHNMVIAAHNYDSHFGRLKYLSPGATVKFTDMDGNEFTYEVGETEILAPTAIEDMTYSDWDLTLFTCTIGGKTRVTVRCRLVSDSYGTGTVKW
jgi:sortase A